MKGKVPFLMEALLLTEVSPEEPVGKLLQRSRLRLRREERPDWEFSATARAKNPDWILPSIMLCSNTALLPSARDPRTPPGSL